MYTTYYEKLKTCLNELYKEETLMKGYIELNNTAKNKILKKFRKYTKNCDYNTDILFILEEEALGEKSSQENFQAIGDEITKLELLFDTHYLKKMNISGSKYLRENLVEKTFTDAQNFYFGFWVAIILVSIFMCLFIYQHFSLDIDLDKKFKGIFPVFR